MSPLAEALAGFVLGVNSNWVGCRADKVIER
jgi:hypothetical protein